MTRPVVSVAALALLLSSTAAMAECPGHTPTLSTQSTPVMTSDAQTAPTTPLPVPAPATADTTKTGS